MKADKMYIPDPQKWYRYYQNSMKGKSNAYIAHLQNGGTDTFMIPLDKREFTTNDKQEDKVEIRLVAPSQQVVDMAKEELKNEQTIKSRKRKKTTSFRLKIVKVERSLNLVRVKTRNRIFLENNGSVIQR